MKHRNNILPKTERGTKMKSFKNAVSTVVLTVTFEMLVGLALPSPVRADQITLGDSSQSISFTGNGAGSVTVSISALSGNAFFDSDPLGSYSFGATSFTAGPGSSGLYPAGANAESFSFTSPDGDTLSGTVQWNTIQDNTTQPKFFGTLTITSKAGDAAFLSNWGSIAAIDFFTTPLSSGGTLDQLAATTGSATAQISSGEVIPEPSAIHLLAVGLVLVLLAARVQQWSKGTRG
jgi:hypothetical protein